MNIRTIRTLAAALMMLMLISPAALADFEAVVTSESMKVYRQQAPHDQIGTLPKGTVVTVKDTNSQAALISYRGYKGIVHIDELEAVKSETSTTIDLSDARTMVTTAKVKVYKKANTNTKKVAVLSKNQHVIVYEVKGKWAYIKTLGGKGGYVKKSVLTKAT